MIGLKNFNLINAGAIKNNNENFFNVDIGSESTYFLY